MASCAAEVRTSGIEEPVTIFDRPERLEYTATSKAMDLEMSLTFTESGSDTLIHATFDPTPKGLMKLLLPILLPMIRRDTAKQHQNFKALCESQARPSSE